MDGIILENKVLGLRYTLPEKIDMICALEQVPENIKYITPYSKARHLQVLEDDDEAHLSIWEKENNQIVGFIILAGIENLNKSLELRRIVIKVKEKGYGRQSLQLIKKYCFEVLGFHRLWLDVFEDNERAIHLYKSEGFQEEGKLRDVIHQQGKYISVFVLSMLEKEYQIKDLKRFL